MKLYNKKNGFVLETKKYSISYQKEKPISLQLSYEGEPIFSLPLFSRLSTPETEENLDNINVEEIHQLDSHTYELVIHAESSLWQQRDFIWTFYEDCIEYQHFAKGSGKLGRCYFFSNGISSPWNLGTSPGVGYNTMIFADKVFKPKPNHGDRMHYSIAVPQSVGIARENNFEGTFDPEHLEDGLFCPPPLCLSFGKGDKWISVGLGEKPGLYLFNALEYTGSLYAGGSFYVNYFGYRAIEKEYASPKMAFHFGYNEFDTVEKYVDWLDDNGFTTERKYENAPWHRLPVFCGWAEQTVMEKLHKMPPSTYATQENYEKWIVALEEKNIPFKTIVIDDKWQEAYGTFKIDTQKWPDMKGFIHKQHEKGRHVLLWVPGYQKEGLPKELCLLAGDTPIAADVSNPNYEAYLREQIRYLVQEIGADGFKEDWIGGLCHPGVTSYAQLFGIEFLRRFQWILYDEAHKWKPDALIETQTPHPLFRESSDVLRLNDLWYGARNVVDLMKVRARIAKLAGWNLVDCDNASSTTADEWWRYMQVQPTIGIPALYFINITECTFESIPDYQWKYLAAYWNDYIEKLEQK